MIISIATIHGIPGYLDPILQTALDGLRPPDRCAARVTDAVEQVTGHMPRTFEDWCRRNAAAFR